MDRIQTINETLLGNPLFRGLAFPFHFLNRDRFVDHELPPALVMACNAGWTRRRAIPVRRCMKTLGAGRERARPRQGRQGGKCDPSLSMRCIIPPAQPCIDFQRLYLSGAFPLYIRPNFGASIFFRTDPQADPTRGVMVRAPIPIHQNSFLRPAAASRPFWSLSIAALTLACIRLID